MKKYLLILFFFFNTNFVYSESNIVYIDVQFIIDNSELGKYYKTKVKEFTDEKKLNLISQENIIKEKETKIKNQKNILNEKEMNNLILELNKLLGIYQTERKKISDNLSKTKNEYTSNILKVLNPLITNYVEENKIKLVIDKKNVLVGAKSLDITRIILDKLNIETKDKKLINDNQ